MKFQKLILHNFESYKDLIFLFDQKGLVLIEGKNGSGKSTILEGILWCLWGVTLKYGEKGYADKVVNRKAKNNCYTKLYFKDDKNQYIVERYRKHKEYKNCVILKINDNVYKGVNTQDQINHILGIDFNTFVSSILFGQEIAKNFASATDLERKKILEKILNLEDFVKYFNNAKEKLNILNSKLSKIDLQLSSYEDKIDDIDDEVIELKKQDNNFVADRENTIVKIKLDIKNIKSKSYDLSKQKFNILIESCNDTIKQMQDNIEEYEVDMSEYDNLVNKNADTKSKIAQLKDKLDESKESIDHIKQGKDFLAGKLCPVCERIVKNSNELTQLAKKRLTKQLDIKDDTKEKEKIIKELSNNIKELSNKLNKLSVKKSEIKKEINTIKSNRDKVSNLNKSINKYKLQINDAENGLKNLNKEKEYDQKKIKELKLKIKELNDQKSPYNKMVKDKLNKLKLLNDKSNQLQSDKKKISKKILYYEFWKIAFSDKGHKLQNQYIIPLKGYILDSIIPTLNKKVNQYSNIITNGKIDIRFSTTKTLKSGETRDEFCFDVDNIDGSDNYKGNSSGEKRTIDIPIQFALGYLVSMRAKNPFNILFLDEPFENLDAKNSSNVVNLLKYISKQYKTVYVISHQDEFKENFNKIIKVKKKKGFSKVI